MSRMNTRIRYSKIKFLTAGLAVLACSLAAPVAAAQALTSFTVSTGTPNNVLFEGYSTTLTATLVGTNASAPVGSVDFFQGSNGSCTTNVLDYGTSSVTTNTAAQPQTGTASYYTPNYIPGTYTVCATYIPSGTSPFLGQTLTSTITVYQAVKMSVLQPSAILQGQALTVSVALSVPAGQPLPSGTVTLYDGSGSTSLQTVTINSNGTVPNLTGTLTGPPYTYTVFYGGDPNYSSQSFYGTAYVSNPLVSISPSAIQSGSPNTTLTVNGNGFVTGPTGSSGSTGSTVQITYNSGLVQYLPTTFVNSSQVTAVVPQAILATPQIATVQVENISTISNAVNLNIHAQQPNTATATATPSTFIYGQANSVSLGATIAPQLLLDPGLPTGSVHFALTGPGANTTQLALGTATLSAAPGNGTLALGPIQTSVDSPPQTAESADLNGDGYADVVSLGNYASTETYPNYLQVFLSSGANSFQSEQTVYTGCPTSSFAVADINGDGKPDLIALCNPGSSGAVANYMLGNGDGTFQQPVPFLGNTTIASPDSIVAGDFNGDGVMDVAIIDGYSGLVQVFTGSKTFGTFTALTASSFQASSYGIASPVVADFNQDGKSDIALLDEPYQGSQAELQLLASKGDGTFSAQTQSINTPAYSLSLAVTDVNGDGYPDIAVADPGYFGSPSDTGQILIFENNGSGSLNAPLTYPVVNPQSVAGAPFPVIGKPPAASATNPASIFFTTFDSTVTTDPVSVTGLNVSGGTINLIYPAQSAGYDVSSYGGQDLVVAGDFDGDGYADAAVFADPTSAGPPATLMPFFYTNSSTATLTSIAQQPNAGTYNLTASYPGSTTYAASISPNVPITIQAAAPTGNLTVPTSATYGQTVTFTATIAGVPGGTIPSGTVDFLINGVDYSGPITLIPGTTSATAQFSLNSTYYFLASTTPYSVTAIYNGDNNYTSTSLGPDSLTINQSAFTLALTSSAATSTAGSFVTFNIQATGAGLLPTGQTIVLSGLPTSAAATVLKTSGQAVYRFGMIPPGTYNVQASYYGSTNFPSETSNTVTLTVTPAPVKITLTSNANPVTYPAPVTLTATTNSGGLGLLTGTVDFANGGTPLGGGTVAIVNGTSGFNPTGSYDSSTTANVVSEAVGDFNHDGKPDLAVLESTGTVTTLLVSLGNGDGTFQPPVSYTVDPGSDAMVAGDFNGDGYTDLAISSTAGYAYVYLASGNASGALTLSQTLPLSTGSNGIAAADFNKDGKIDLAAIGTGGVSVFLNTGSGAFATTPAYVYNSGYSNFTGIAVADFNKDGYPDIAISTSTYSEVPGTPPGSVTLLTNTGTAPLGFTASSIPVSGYATNIAVGDFNGDTYPDIAVLSGGDSTVDVLLNHNGAFNLDVSYATVGEPVGIVTADFNKDGYDDIAISGVAGGAGGGSGILFGSASGAMTTASNLPTTYGSAIATADLNGDGNPDLLIGDQSVAAFVDSTTQTSISNVVLPAGTDSLTAAFTPDPTTGTFFASGTSPVFKQTVNQATPIVTWATPAPIVYGTALSPSQLNATASVPGTFNYTPAAGTILTAGPHTLSVLFQPTSANYMPVTTTVTLNVTQATPVLTWANPAPIYYGIPLSSTQLNATANVPGAFTYTPPAGTVLSIGQHPLSVLFTPTDTTDYATATTSVTLTVQPGSILTSIQPSSGNLGDPATTITLTGAGFLGSSVAQLNGTALATTYVSPTTLQAIIPASVLTTVQTGSVTVATPGEPTSSAVQFNVIAPTAHATFTGPSTAPPSSQPTLTFQLAQAYPVAVKATFTLTVQPASSGGITDPAVQFSSGGTSYTVTLPANSTTPVPLQLQTGTLAGTITVTAALSAGGTDITPTSLQPLVIQVPQSAPVITSVSIARNGKTLTVTVQGYSSTREVQSANFQFIGASGSPIANPDVTVRLNTAFANWYSQATSNQYGSAFSYVQSFTLSQDASTIGSVSVTLTNNVGASNTESAQ